ncbi:hypothetical protein OF83DRAFT_1167557 [Amylostereum chailletii]|nr:hypothetical protein OF83DRAFT_1167557 [Amylostereum chailletii]
MSVSFSRPTSPRGMSWRKPVPSFLMTAPDPSPSDIQEPPSPSGSMDITLQDEVPPLPQDWKVVIDSFQNYSMSQGPRSSQDDSDRLMDAQRQGMLSPVSPRETQQLVPSSRRPSARSVLSHKLSVAHNYRPPTPPLRASSVSPAPASPYVQAYPEPTPKFVAYEPERKSSLPASSHAATSVTARPSLQSLESDSRTAVSGPTTGTWYLAGPAMDEWKREKDLGRQKAEDLHTQGPRPTGLPFFRLSDDRPAMKLDDIQNSEHEGLPMHYVSLDRLRRKDASPKTRSCRLAMSQGVAAAGHAVASWFKPAMD